MLSPVGFTYNAGNDQRALPGVLGEETPLPSEQVLRGDLLSERRRQALAELRVLLVERHPDVDPDEWRVFVATVAPPYGHLPRAPGTPARAFGVMQAAKDCFPLLSASAALARFREVQSSLKVRTLVADFRSLEIADVHEQRGMVREALHATIARGTNALYLIDPTAAPNEWSKLSACVTAACKVLSDMDGLRRDSAEASNDLTGSGPPVEADPTETLVAKARKVQADLRARVPETA